VRQQIPVLRGLAILAVVCNHAAGWGYTAMFWWTHRYRQVTPPNYDQVGTFSYYTLVAIQQLALFSVPVFLFISGFFVAYAAYGSQPTLSWKVVRVRITNLLWPYLVWSLVIFGGDFLQGTSYSLVEYFRRLAVGDATAAYFFVPLLCQFYLLAPFIARWGRAKSGQLLLVSALIQLTAIGLLYLRLFRVVLLNVHIFSLWMLIFWWAFYFPLGVVCGFHFKLVRQWLGRFKWVLLMATVVLGALSIIESEVLYNLTQDYNWARGVSKFSTFLYTVAFILLFLAFDQISLPFTRAIDWIGTRSYGIYLLHPKVTELAARVIYHIAPWLLAHQVLYQPVLVASGLGIPLLFMTGVAKSPARKFYRYLFG
jgi:membrane-bound acyltransferase YfiQ involved in biofilm formation